MPPAETQLSVLIKMEQHLKLIADNGRRIADALESIERKTINPDGTSGGAN